MTNFIYGFLKPRSLSKFKNNLGRYTKCIIYYLLENTRLLNRLYILLELLSKLTILNNYKLFVQSKLIQTIFILSPTQFRYLNIDKN